jgi:hypothetical protein
VKPNTGNAEREPVDVRPLESFLQWEPVPLHPRLDFQVLKYQEHPLPVAAESAAAIS